MLGDPSEKFRLAIFALPLLLLSFALHELGHVLAATAFGDPTPRKHGRLTWNPIRQLDRNGSLMVIITYFIFYFPMGFAWAPVDDRRMRRPHLHGALTALAGPAVNFLILIVSVFILKHLPVTTNYDVVVVINYVAIFNAILVIFNLLPVPPLDGSRIVGSFMRGEMRQNWRALDQYGILFILGLVLIFSQQFTQLITQLLDILTRVADVITG